MPWTRAIALIDMDAFFASVEQRDQPQLKGRPLAIVNGGSGTTIITCSYEARDYGIKTGMRVIQARELCAELVVLPSRSARYAEISSTIMSALVSVTPDIEIYSIDEAYLDVTSCQRLWGEPEVIAEKIKQTVWDASGLTCSVGMSGDKTTAKFAAKQNKPNGVKVIHPHDAQRTLAPYEVDALCGINKGVKHFLNRYGVYYCGQMVDIPASVLMKRFGAIGHKIWLMTQGLDPSVVSTRVTAPKSIGHGKVLPPGLNNRYVIERYFMHMCFKVAARLRRSDLQTEQVDIAYRTQNTWYKSRYKPLYACNDYREMFKACQTLLTDQWRQQGLYNVQVTAVKLHEPNCQLDLFVDVDYQLRLVDQTIDSINQRYGALTIMPARLLGHQATHDVIAPSWQPTGHRNSIG